MVREKDPLFWIKHFEMWYEQHKEQHIIVTDVRFQNEAKCIHKFGGKIIKITRGTSTDTHESETESVNIQTDFEIENNGTKSEFIEQVLIFIQNLTSFNSQIQI